MTAPIHELPALLTPRQWQASDNGETATPPCPNCGQFLGIRFGMWWRGNGRDAWLCDKCGEFEAVCASSADGKAAEWREITP